MTDSLLELRNLTVAFGTPERPLRVVDEVSFTIRQGEAVGLVGESGSGKSMTSLAIMRLVPEPPAQVTGEVWLDGTDLMALPKARMQAVRGKDIAMIFQEPMSSLNPVMTIGRQVGEVLALHGEADRARRRARVIELLRLVGIPEPEKRLNAYPEEFSGGMRQRVMIAMAVACNPRLLIADEPTTALDVTIQAQVLELMADIRRRLNSAILLISHNLGVIADVCERVVVMYAGHIVEDADIESIFHRPAHPYTQGLLRSMPTVTEHQERLYQIPGSVPPPGAIKAGCPFRPRCPLRIDRCAVEMPPLLAQGPGHRAACWVTAGEAVA